MIRNPTDDDLNPAQEQPSGMLMMPGNAPDDQNDVVKPKRAIYTGITGFSFHKRLKEHQKCISDDNLKNAMAKHKHQEHPSSQDIKLESRIIRGGIMENLSRYIGEALEIEASQNDSESKTLNS